MAPSAREAIQAAFLSLLEERPLRDITVKDIVQSCGVNRNSFYYHFKDIPALLQENMEAGDIGKTLMKGGMKMSSLVPSTMGTLMSSGIMEGGKALKGKDAMGPRELADCLTAFAAGVQKRGKCQPGDRTILDALDAGAQAAAKAAEEGGDLSLSLIHI